MRRLLALSGVIAVTIGCTPKPDQLSKGLENALLLHFNNLNDEAEREKIDAKATHAMSELTPPMGRQFNTYAWHPAGAILRDVECGYCHAKQMVVMYRGDAILCTSCGSRDPRTHKQGRPLIPAGLQPADLDQFGGGKKLMLEPVKGGQPGEIIAIVRYVRRNWTLDDRGTVALNPKVQEQIGAWTNPEGKNNYYANGYHRLDDTFVATAAFVYDGKLTQLDASVTAKLEKGESVQRTLWKYSSIAVEEPVRPWNAPRRLDTANVRQY